MDKRNLQTETMDMDTECTNTKEKVPFWTSQRMLMSVLVFFGVMSHSQQRVNLSIAMVCMVKVENSSSSSERMGEASDFSLDTALAKAASVVRLPGDYPNVTLGYTDTQLSINITEHETNHVDGCEHFTKDQTENENGEFTWSKEVQGLLLGAYFWGYLVLQIPAGLLSERYGARRVIMFSMAPVAVLNLVAPVCARVSPWLLMGDRVLLGLAQSTFYAGTISLFTKWVPTAERGRLIAIAFSGGEIGNAVMFPIGGYVCEDLGWTPIFYFTGGSGLLWCVLWWVLVRDSPSHSRRISLREKHYLAREVSHPGDRKGDRPKVPWKAMLSSPAFLSILVIHCCSNYGFFMIMTQMPTYMKEVLKFDMVANGVYSMLPYLSLFVSVAVFGFIADQLISRKILSCEWTRKLMSSIGLFCPAGCMFLLTFIDCRHQLWAVVVLCACLGFAGACFSGYLVNHADIAPAFAGTLFGVTNMASATTGIIAPYIVAIVTLDKTQESWTHAFIIASAIHVFGGLVYLVFGKGHIQTWALPPRLELSIEVPEENYKLKGERLYLQTHEDFVE